MRDRVYVEIDRALRVRKWRRNTIYVNTVRDNKRILSLKIGVSSNLNNHFNHHPSRLFETRSERSKEKGREIKSEHNSNTRDKEIKRKESIYYKSPIMWEAANAPSVLPRDEGSGEILRHQNQHHNKQQISNERRIISSETIEAALSRLSKAYTTSMECIGAIHNTNRMILKEEQTSTRTATIDSALATIHTVSKVARTTLETAILLDPLVVTHDPTLHQTMIDLSNNTDNNRYDFVQEEKPTPPTISSTAHKSTLVKLAYLSLVNYSDLLLQASSVATPMKNGSILDRGIVKPLRIATTSNSDDYPPETHRLAVAALIDAVNLDPTDPITWLKLACASRKLEHVSENLTTVQKSHHRRLQRNALERGSVCLAEHLPPNRTILRALKELNRERESDKYISTNPKATTMITTKTVELTRYSWAILGKMILRACKGDEGSAPWEVKAQNTNSKALFGSPTVSIQLSPMLVLPSRVLGKICQFLENTDIWKFEATCKALSVNIIAARASMEENDESDHHESDHDDDDDDDAADLLLQRQEQRQRELLSKIQNSTPSEADSENPVNEEGPSEAQKSEEKQSEETPTSNNDNNNSNNNDNTTTSSRAPPVPARQSSRSSKRVRMKEISTSKKQDREAKRNSFHYCFLAATLSCTKEKHNDMAEDLLDTKELEHLFRGKEDKSLVSGNGGRKKGSNLQQLSMDSTQNSMEAVERISEASLSSFVQKWSSKNSGPMELLERYLGHVAMFAEEVFGSDSPTMGLHSCLLNSFQALLLRSGSLSSSIVPRFFRPLTETKSLTRTLELFAMDLIHAELIFRQCDRYTPKVVEFDDDANMISLMIPALVECCNEVKRDINAQQNENVELSTKFHFLRVRCYWLTASYYLWRSRIAQAIYLSREAEDEGIHFIGMTIDCFDSPVLISVKSVKIPHLVSPGRQDPYWREISPTSLSKFRDDIQASSVVSHARQRFQELVSNLKAESPEEEVSTQISTNDARVLVEIGKKLFDRYDSQYGSKNSKLSELVDNFLEMRGGDIVFRGDTPKDSKLSDEVMMQREPYKVEDLQRVSNPTILSMLVICLNMDEKNRLCIAKLLVRLVLTAVDMHTSLLKQIADFRLSRKQTDGYHSDDAMSDSDDDMSDIGPSSTQKDNDEKKVRQCGHFLKFLIRCLCDAVSSHLSGDEKSKLLISDEFSDMMNSVLDFSNRWYQFTVNYLSIPNDSVDRDLVRLVENILIKSKTVKDGQKVHKKLESICFRGLVQIMVSQQEVLKGLVTAQVDRSRRSARQRLCINRAEYIGLVASKMGLTLSQNLASVDNFDMSKGRLFEGHGIREENDHVSKPLTHQEEIIFLRSVRWLRKYAFQDDGESLSSSQANVVNAFDRPITKELKIPISTLIIGICGSASCSRQRGDPEASGEQDNLSLTEFFDSDASMNDWRSDSEEHGTSEKSKKELVRVICHAVHCIALVFEMVDEKDTVNRFLEIYCDAEFGPLLPLVSARVLNFFADTLLIHFGEDDVEGNDRGNLWSEGYPSHTKYTGAVLDTSLHKTYRWLYGFALVGEQNYQSTAGSEMAHTMNDISEIAEKGFKLESTAASGQLYRCIMRAYAGGRRTPPKHALEAVSAALPPMKESELNKALRRFAFSGNNTDLDIDSILTMSANWDSSFQILRDSIQQNKDSLDESGEASLEELEAMEVRRGLSKQLALGPLPIVTTDPKAKSDAGADDDRAQTISNEMAISKKFNAILNDLCLLDSDNWEGWYRASQCCVMKADTIADRLGLTLGFSRIKNFSISVDRGLSLRTLNIVDLRKEQELEERMSKKVKFLGDDYSVYMNNAWSSFSSLRDCVATMKKQYSNIDEEGIRSNNNIPLSIWNEIDSKYDKGDFLEWQEACGGVFVKALRNLSVRFMCIALYLLQSKPEITCDHKVLMSDVCETLGNIYYSELIASQNYGWPMHAMTTSRKRSLAIAAKSCYQASIKHADDSLREEDDINDHSTWDLQFMVGKVR